MDIEKISEIKFENIGEIGARLSSYAEKLT